MRERFRRSSISIPMRWVAPGALQVVLSLVIEPVGIILQQARLETSMLRSGCRRSCETDRRKLASSLLAAAS